MGNASESIYPDLTCLGMTAPYNFAEEDGSITTTAILGRSGKSCSVEEHILQNQQQLREYFDEYVIVDSTDEARVLYCELNMTSKLRISLTEATFELLLERTSLKTTFQYSQELPQIYDSVRSLGRDVGHDGFDFSSDSRQHLFRYEHRSRTTFIIALVGGRYAGCFKKISAQWKNAFLHPSFAVWFLCTLANHLDSNHDDIWYELSDVVAATGFQVWSKEEVKVTTDFVDIARRLNGLDSASAWRQVRYKTNRLLLTEMRKIEYRDLDVTICDTMSNWLKVLDLEFELLLAIGQQTDRCIANQMTALLHLSNQKEARASLEIAKNSHKIALAAKLDSAGMRRMAEDSRTIALAAKKDSASMKTLAVVGIVLLPGTFISSLFSMSMFDWQSEKYISDKFWIYWAITIPLTIITVGLWHYMTEKQNEIDRKAVMAAEKDRRLDEEAAAIELEEVSTGNTA